LSSEREPLKAEFLKRAGFATARREPLAGDASTRRYERLRMPDGAAFIFMDQPPALESQPCPPDATPEERIASGYNACARLAAGRVEAFVAAAGYLRSLGLSAPEVFAFDAPAGLAVLEDLGDDLFARLIEAGQDETELYAAAVDALIRLHEQAPPERLEAAGQSWPLLAYDGLVLKTYSDMFLEWWPKFAGMDPFGPEAVAEWEALWTPIRARGEAAAVGPKGVFGHRDYHAENLVWLKDRSPDVARVGMLDFQDAVRTHPAWDLLSLLQDARRDVDPALERLMLGRYLAARPDLDAETFHADYRALAAFNAARILGPIFARQVVHFGRPKYKAFMPRTWRYLKRNLESPELAGLKRWFEHNIPAEARA
jgi:aminoglycoside/choline kinase family phosphotransferase